MTTTTTLKFTRVRPGWYETGDNVEGAYVISSDEPGSWVVSRWTMVRGFGADFLELLGVESAGTLAYAKRLAEFDAQMEVAR